MSDISPPDPPLARSLPKTRLSIADHIVLSGGGVYLVKLYGTLRQCIQDGSFHPRQLKSICGTSAGSIIGAICAIAAIPGKYIDWEWVDEYMQSRDVLSIFHVDVSAENLLHMYKECGIFNKNCILRLIGPIFFHHGIQIDKTTLADFRELTQGLTLVCMATEYKSFEPVELSAGTHPTMLMLDALYATSCIPLIHQPYKWQTDDNATPTFYVDGGLLYNYPMQYYAEQFPDDCLFGFSVHSFYSADPTDTLNLTDYIMHLVRGVTLKTQYNIQESSCDQVYIPLNFELTQTDIITDSNTRKRVMEDGSRIWVQYLENTKFHLDEADPHRQP